MSDRYRQAPREREYADPAEDVRPVPWLFLALVGGMIAWGAWYILQLRGTADPTLGDRRTVSALAPAAPVADGTADGARLYASNCAACHQANGLGVTGVFPPLAGSAWVTGSPTRLVQILLHGIQGPIEVLGSDYNGLMPPWKQLADAEIAAIASYVRTQWGNAAAPVDEATVAAERARTADRTAPWAGGAALADVP